MGRQNPETRAIDRWANEMDVVIEKEEDGEWHWSDGEGRAFFGFASLADCFLSVEEVHGELDDDEEDEVRWEEEFDERMEFADPGGKSALRAETKDNPRNLPCPNCGQPNRLTPADKARGYQCDACADQAERGGY